MFNLVILMTKEAIRIEYNNNNSALHEGAL
jgi:hypothetical protein